MNLKSYFRKIFMIVIGVIILSNSLLTTYGATASKVYLFGVHDSDGADRYSWMKTTAGQYKLRDNQATVKQYNYFTSKTILSALKKANYFTIHTHGSKTGILAINKSGTESTLTIKSIQKNTFYSLRVCYIAACNAAPVAEAIKNRGAKTTIGYTKTVNTACNRTMHTSFNAYFTIGQTVTKAMSSAKSNVYKKHGKYGNVDSYKIYGDTKQKF